jgi:hypothetical protein
MVTPLVNGDSDVYEPELLGPGNSNGGYADDSPLPFRAAADGSAVAYVSTPGPISLGGNGSTGLHNGNENLARRSASGVWSAANIQPPGRAEPVYQAFSNDLSVGILDSTEVLSAGAPQGGYDVLYARTTSDGSYRPLFSVKPPHRSAEEFVAFRVNHRGPGRPLNVIEGQGPVTYAGSSADLSHMLFEANDSLTPLAEQAVPTAEQNDLYDSVAGNLYLVNVLPNGEPDSDATFGAPQIANNGLGNFGTPDFSHAISADGSRIFWSAVGPSPVGTAPGPPLALYVRENDTQPQSPIVGGKCAVPTDGCTVQVDAAEAGAPGPGGGGRFWTASSEGSRVFFTDENRLTNDSTAASGEPDLYEYDVNTGVLTDLSVDTNAGEHANVQGVVGAGDDGSYVYFVAEGALASGATPGACCNLYVRHEGEPVQFIATLSSQDEGGGGSGIDAYGDWIPGLGVRQAQVTPDGRHMAFVSSAKLTDYENYGHYEVYVYESGSGVGDGLFCASCGPLGVPPTYPYGTRLSVSRSNTYMQRFISSDGSRVFFDSEEALVPQDTNGQLDVYEWEQDGAGECHREAGCVYLLSGGTSTDGSFFLDASESGNDVFIVTRAQLLAQDQNEVFDVYDARVDAPVPVAPPACTGTGCQGVPGAPPIFATPSSVTFSGAGNFGPPPKTTVKKKEKKKPKKKRKTRKRARRSAGRHGRGPSGGLGAGHGARAHGKAGRS